ncbi:MAG: LacI family DNA-binding transcriptional regulator [Bacillota bacterium]|nr:LacI family DNA-binding transcriptional regulator [Bacillota bacterium]
MTIKDIAERCGVSVSTVSRVLNGHPDVSEAVRRKVLQVVQEVHYVPNNSARDLVRPQTNAIGLVVRGIGNPFFSKVIRSIEKETEKFGFTLIFHQISSGEDELSAGAGLVQSKKLRGLILLGGQFDYTEEQIAVLRVPFVCCSYTNSFGGLKEEVYSSVSINDEKEAYRAVMQLIGQGHRKIALVLDSKRDHSISELRYYGYRKALEESGIPYDEGLVAETGRFDMEDAYHAVRRLIEKRNDFTALFVIADSMAVASMKALADTGRRVPEDCSVIAIDGIQMSAYTVPTLTTLVQPAEEMGECAVRILLDMVENNAKNRHCEMKTTLRAGGTVASI